MEARRNKRMGRMAEASKNERGIVETPISWRRFWEPVGDSQSNDVRPEAFLEDPEGYLAKHRPSQLKATDALLTHRCLVLCGEPGMGKSQTLEQYRSAITLLAGGAAFVFWRSFHRDLLGGEHLLRQLKESTQWKAWLEHAKEITIVVDAMDEGLVDAPNLMGVLVQEFYGKPLHLGASRSDVPGC